MAYRKSSMLNRTLALVSVIFTGYIGYMVYEPPAAVLKSWQASTPSITWAEDGEDGGGLGTGWVYNLDDGIIITNHHVIDGAKEIDVTFPNTDPLKAVVIGVAPKLDIAVLRVNPTTLKGISGAAELTITTAALGDTVYSIGHPHGLYSTVNKGIVSYERRVSREAPRQILIQTDASINAGNSGGPLLDRFGRLVGVNVSIISKTGENNGLGFAVHPISLYKAIEEIAKFGKTTRPLMGIGFDEKGNIKVSPDGAAAKAGLRDLDMIHYLDDTLITGTEDLLVYMARRSVGDVVIVTTPRGEFTVTLEAEVEKVPGAELTDEELAATKEALAIMDGEDLGSGIIKRTDVTRDGGLIVIIVTAPGVNFEEHAKAGACTAPLSTITLSLGLTIIYEDEDGKELDKFDFDKTTCEEE